MGLTKSKYIYIYPGGFVVALFDRNSIKASSWPSKKKLVAECWWCCFVAISLDAIMPYPYCNVLQQFGQCSFFFAEETGGWVQSDLSPKGSFHSWKCWIEMEQFYAVLREAMVAMVMVGSLLWGSCSPCGDAYCHGFIQSDSLHFDWSPYSSVARTIIECQSHRSCQCI